MVESTLSLNLVAMLAGIETKQLTYISIIVVCVVLPILSFTFWYSCNRAWVFSHPLSNFLLKNICRAPTMCQAHILGSGYIMPHKM